MNNFNVIGKLVFVDILNSGCTEIKSRAVLEALVKVSLSNLAITYEAVDFSAIVEATLSYMETVSPSGTTATVVTPEHECSCESCICDSDVVEDESEPFTVQDLFDELDQLTFDVTEEIYNFNESIDYIDNNFNSDIFPLSVRVAYLELKVKLNELSSAVVKLNGMIS